MDHMARGVGNVDVGALPMNFQRIRQEAPRCGTWSLYTAAAHCAPGRSLLSSVVLFCAVQAARMVVAGETGRSAEQVVVTDYEADVN